MAELEVEREVARILAELSGRVARKEEELLLALSLLARIDAIQARSLLADELSAAEPTVTDAGETNLRSALHPLLVLSGRPVVPNDLRLGRPYLCLILTGPNAGGKTVALKTLGLLTLMAMAGLSIPASPDSTVSVFRNLFVAVGDEQSVEGDLSTYSAHIRRLNEILVGRGPRFAGAARRGRLGDGSARGGGDRPRLPRNAGGPGGARGGDDALRGTEGDRLHGSPVRERLDGVRRGTPSADVPAVAGGPGPFHGDRDRAVPRLSGRGSRAGEGVPLRPRPEPAGGDRPPGAGARTGARRGGGACGAAQGGGGSGAAARRGAWRR